MANRARRILDTFVRGEYFSNWQAEAIEEGGYMRSGSDARDRYERCHEATENGGDGSTHAEHLNDMRQAFSDWLRDRRYQKRNRLAEYPYRLEAAVYDEIDSIEAWHQQNGSLEQEIG